MFTFNKKILSLTSRSCSFLQEKRHCVLKNLEQAK